MNYSLIELFGVCVKGGKKVKSQKLKLDALKKGYVIHPDVCNEYTKAFIDSIKEDYNSTFYKNWSDVNNSTGRYIDQFIHYMCAYTLNSTYLPDCEINIPNNYTSYKVIMPCTYEELFEKCTDMLYSGIALKQTTSKVLVNYIVDCILHKNIGVLQIDKVANREAQAKLCKELNITPNDKFGLLRYIVYSMTDNAELINSQEFKNRMKLAGIRNIAFDLSSLSEEQLISLSSIFNRYKYVFMALKDVSNKVKKHNIAVNNIKIINKLSKLSKKYHKPLVKGLWEVVVSEEHDIDEVMGRINELDNFRLVRLLQGIKENIILYLTCGNPMYNIRNGKTYIKTNKIENEFRAVKGNQMYNYWKSLYEVFFQELATRLAKKRDTFANNTVKFPTHLNLACPSSEKNFIGNIPFGSYYDMTNNNFIGIYWRGEDGAQDFDLSFIDYKGNKLGWDSSWNRNLLLDAAGNRGNIIYSGDIVRANPEASEVIYFKGADIPNGVVYVNLFNGNPGSKFRFMVAQDDKEINYLTQNYMIDPSTIQMSTDMHATKDMMMVGFIKNKKLYMCELGYKNVKVSGHDNLMDDIFERKSDIFIDLKMMLTIAGYTEWKENTEGIKPGIDLSDLSKDTLINLFS